MSYDEVSAEAALIATMERPRIHVRRAMQSIRHELERRELVHDESKYREDEFPGFVRINRTAREHPYGSEEYKASIRKEGAAKVHQLRHGHHPEKHLSVSHPNHGSGELWSMTWLDIIEMVCDWWSATKTYGTTPWDQVLKIQRDRWPWTDAQWWLVEQVAEWIEKELSDECR